MRLCLRVLGILLSAMLAALLVLGFAMSRFFRGTEPEQPSFGFAGNWRSRNVFGFEERPLPPADQLWSDYSSWTSNIPYGSRIYIARVEPHFRTNFHSWMSKGDTPMGAQRYSNLRFSYSDPTSGSYEITWMLRGKHDFSFLQSDTNSRLYQLQPHGTQDGRPPRLEIVSIEGMDPSKFY